MDLISCHQTDKTWPIIHEYLNQLLDFFHDRGFIVYPAWQSSLYESSPDDFLISQRNLSHYGLTNITYFTTDSQAIIWILKESHSNGLMLFTPAVSIITTTIFADEVKIIFDSYNICSLVETRIINTERVFNTFGQLIDLNKLLSDYIAPEIISAANTGAIKSDLKYFADSLKDSADKQNTSIAGSKAHNLFTAEDDIFVIGMWELTKRFKIRVPNTIFAYISLNSFIETKKIIIKRLPGCEFSSKSMRIHKACYGHHLIVKQSSSGKNSVNNFIVLVCRHEMIIPITNSDSIPLLHHLFWATYIFFSEKNYTKESTAEEFSHAILAMAKVIITDHIEKPEPIREVVGIAGASRYVFAWRQMTKTKFRSSFEQYDGINIEGDIHNMQKIEIPLTLSKKYSKVHIVPIYEDRIEDDNYLDGGEHEAIRQRDFNYIFTYDDI